jgi:hypothetical protein
LVFSDVLGPTDLVAVGAVVTLFVAGIAEVVVAGKAVLGMDADVVAVVLVIEANGVKSDIFMGPGVEAAGGIA